MDPQQLFKPFELSGIGLHSGQKTTVRVSPANTGEGRYFVRVDLPEKPVIPAHSDSVLTTTLSTELGQDEAKVRTVEHLLAALLCCGVENARIEVDGPELPLLDGSALLWVNALLGDTDNLDPLNSLKPDRYSINEPIWECDGSAFVAALPSPELRFTYGIDFPYSAIGNQWFSWNPQQESFTKEIAPARTFGFADQIEQLKAMGLIQGGSLDNALVCDHNGWLNPPLRFDNEPVRHKMLDLLGDLSLLGTIPQAHYLAYKASHKLHVQLVNSILVHC
jgi:UDP-3-O-[3-hydroxymyristoyl] N-acetylglucosamine deacetylase